MREVIEGIVRQGPVKSESNILTAVRITGITFERPGASRRPDQSWLQY